MNVPLHITFRNMAPSVAVEGDIRDRVGKLEHIFHRITSCRVVVEAPHRHHNQGNLFHVRIDISVPGSELVVNRDPSQHISHSDAYVAIRDAFEAAKKKLQAYADKHFRDHEHEKPALPESA